QQRKKKLNLKGTVDLAFVVRHPAVLTAVDGGSAAGGEQPVVGSDVETVVERAARDVVTMREREGAALAPELIGRLHALEAGWRSARSRSLTPFATAIRR